MIVMLPGLMPMCSASHRIPSATSTSPVIVSFVQSCTLAPLKPFFSWEPEVVSGLRTVVAPLSGLDDASRSKSAISMSPEAVSRYST
ncbi:MAG TPA: hypothetical protein QGF58_20635 [Myxococcota bacterium]|nr:hypothetical protein [Myxococcota bacterium]